jgi:hypothetical protein
MGSGSCPMGDSEAGRLRPDSDGLCSGRVLHVPRTGRIKADAADLTSDDSMM